MNTRVYEKREPHMFCPSCHKEVTYPFPDNINVTGQINIDCGACGKGQISIVSKAKKVKEKSPA